MEELRRGVLQEQYKQKMSGNVLGPSMQSQAGQGGNQMRHSSPNY